MLNTKELITLFFLSNTVSNKVVSSMTNFKPKLKMIDHVKILELLISLNICNPVIANKVDVRHNFHRYIQDIGCCFFKISFGGSFKSQNIQGTLVTTKTMLGNTIAVFIKHSVNLGVWLFQVKFKSQKASTQKFESIDFILSNASSLWNSNRDLLKR